MMVLKDKLQDYKTIGDFNNQAVVVQKGSIQETIKTRLKILISHP